MLQFENKFYECKIPRPNKEVKSRLKKFSNIVKTLEVSLIESQKNDQLLLMTVRMNTSKNLSLENQLQEALKENQQLLDVIQLRNEDQDVSRNCSKVSLGTSFSTISLVNLQYKYEELLSNYKGLLRVLELRNGEVKKHIDENSKLQEQNQKLSADLENLKETVWRLERKNAEIKQRKHEKMARLKAQRHTLAIVHNRLVALLHRQCMEKNEFIDSLLKITPRSEKGLLLQEIRKNNILTYKNFQLHQEVDYLRTFLRLSRTNSKETVASDRKSGSPSKKVLLHSFGLKLKSSSFCR